MVRSRHLPQSAAEHALPREGALDSERCANEVIDLTVDVLVAMGYSPRELARRFTERCGQKPEPQHSAASVKAAYNTQLGEVLGRWSSERAFLDATGAPLLLPLSGGRVSLTSLIERAVPGTTPRRVVDTLLRGHAIRREGARYRLLLRFMSNATIAPLAHAQSLSSLRGLLKTVRHNRSSTRPAQRLLERKAANYCIPVRKAPAVRQFLKQRGSVWLEKIDTHLTEQAVTPGSEPTISVHVVAFVHEEPHEGDLAEKRKPMRRGRRRR